MREPLYMLLKVAHDKLLDVSCREIVNHMKVIECADEVASIAKMIADRSRKEIELKITPTP